MVGFISNTNNNHTKVSVNESDLSFVDSFLDLESINDLLIEESPSQNINNLEEEKVEFLEFEEFMDMVDKEKYDEKKTHFNESTDNGVSLVGKIVREVGYWVEEELESVVAVGGSDISSSNGVEVKVDGEERGNSNVCIEEKMDRKEVEGETGSLNVCVEEKTERKEVEVEETLSLNVCIEEKMEKVSLEGGVIGLVVGDGKDCKEVSEEESGGSSSSSSESEDESSSSSEASSSSEDEDEEEVERRNVEEGEIVDDDVEKMVSWSDDEDEDVAVPKGPIRSKNEIKDLPVVPRVDVTLQPNHQTLPVGIILSIVGAQVIVEGVEKHNPLNEGSILWITESRVPLGLVDEIFGPVKNPYYIVRYNSEDEVPVGITVGTPISFVPEFVNHVLNDGSLYKKGYDASNENDEELSDEVEFSDDEKEAEYRRMQKITKRGTNDEGFSKRKKDKRKNKKQDGNWKNNRPADQKQTHVDLGNCSFSSGNGQPNLVPLFNQRVHSAGIIAPPNGIWTMPGQQQQPNMILPNGFPSNGMPWMQQNHLQHSYQMPLPQGMPFQQPFGPNQMLLPNSIMPGRQTNFVVGSANPPWTGFVGQTGAFTQTAPGLMGLQGQQAQQFMPVQGVPSPGLNMEQNSAEQLPSFNMGNNQNSQQFSPGNSSGHGRGRGSKPYHRGRGGRFPGGRGRHQRN